MNNIVILSVKILVISDEDVGKRIDNFLRIKLKGIPKSMLYRLLRKGAIRVCKRRIKPKYKLCFRDKVFIPSMHITEHKNNVISPHLKKVKILSDIILYEDDYILVLNKPSGIAVHGGSGLNFGIIEGLRVLRPKAHFLELVHRLDRDTSGVLLIAKKISALRSLHKQLQNREIQKDYLALVYGKWKSHVKIVQVPLLKNILNGGERIVQVNYKGKLSETHFEIKERYAFSTLMRCIPVTGRTHQIRVHAKYVGHPVAFDNRYGNREFNKQLAEIGLSRMFLHALVLKFVHPHTEEIFRIEAPLDGQLVQCIKILRNRTCIDNPMLTTYICT